MRAVTLVAEEVAASEGSTLQLFCSALSAV